MKEGTAINRLLTVTLNSSLDKAVRLPALTAGAINRASQVAAVAGGKGNNTARVASQLGIAVRATGFVGGFTGEFLVEQLLTQHIEDRFVRIGGVTRTCLALVDEFSATVTEVLEPGPSITEQEWVKLLGLLPVLAAECPYSVIAGSLPPGVPGNAYGLIVTSLQVAGSKVLLDASGTALHEALAARPWIVKINEHEATAWAEAGLQDAIRRLRQHAQVVVITRGAQGALLFSSAGNWQAISPPVAAKSAVGSGDAFSAGMIWSLLSGQGLRSALQAAVAAGAANAMTLQTGYLDPEVFHQLRHQVQVTEVFD